MTVGELMKELAKQPDWLVVTDRIGNEVINLRPWLGDLRLETEDANW